jgi:tetratricopeptide (TPR) repeat protein
MGDLTRALADYDEAIRLKPGNAITLGARGRIYADLGQYDRALADFSEVIRLKSESAEAHYLRGKTRYISGDNAGAVVDFTEAIKLDPTHAWAYRHRGDAFARLGNRARADADRAMVDRLARPSARPVKFREDIPVPTPPASKAGAGDRGGTALSGPGLHQPTRRPTVSSAPANPQ